MSDATSASVLYTANRYLAICRVMILLNHFDLNRHIGLQESVEWCEASDGISSQEIKLTPNHAKAQPKIVSTMRGHAAVEPIPSNEWEINECQHGNKGGCFMHIVYYVIQKIIRH